MFDESKHVVSSVPDNGLFYISVDYGTLNPFSMGLWCVSDGTAYRVKEYYYDGRNKGHLKTDEEYYEELEKFCGDFPIQWVIVDPSAASFKATIRKHAKYFVRDAKNDVLNGIKKTAVAIQQGKLKFHESCVDTFREFKAYRWDSNANEDKVIKENDHAMDDIRYFVNTVFARSWQMV
jgi:PBSX family phage terminase large subunit